MCPSKHVSQRHPCTAPIAFTCWHIGIAGFERVPLLCACVHGCVWRERERASARVCVKERERESGGVGGWGVRACIHQHVSTRSSQTASVHRNGVLAPAYLPL